MKVSCQFGSFEFQPEEAIAMAKSAVDGIRRPDGTIFGLRDDQALLLAGGVACFALFGWSQYASSRPKSAPRKRR